MNWPPLQLALREVRATYTNPRALAVMGIVGVVAGLAGPFGTFEQLPQGLRVIYWLAVSFSTYGAGIFTGMAIGHALPARFPRWPAIILASLGAALPVTALVVMFNIIFMGDAGAPPMVATLYLYCLVVCTGVTILLDVVARADGGTEAMAAPAPPALLERIAPHLRGSLRRISTADHYVEVHTDKGMEMVLMRFADALRETGDVAGVQIHRGHWVALDAVRDLRRVDGRPVVELVSGEILPVSRGQLAATRAALEAR